jgi:uridylate kinase
VIFAAGIGNPFFTTDTGAALRAIEMNCDALLKGTQVDGVYTADPKLDASATRYNQVAYDELLIKNLRVMDPSAVSLMRDNNVPIVVFSLKEEGSLLNVLHGRGTSTTISKHGGSTG